MIPLLLAFAARAAANAVDDRAWKPSVPEPLATVGAVRVAFDDRAAALTDMMLEYAGYGTAALSAIMVGIAAYLCYSAHDTRVRSALNDPRRNIRPIAVLYRRRPQ